MARPPQNSNLPPGGGRPAQPRAAVHALGCRLNLAEAQAIKASLEAAGYQVVDWGQEAEVFVLNSCTVTGASDAKSRQALSAMRRRYPNAKLALVGCYAQTDGEALASQGLVDLVVGNGAKMEVAQHLKALAQPPAQPVEGAAATQTTARATTLVRPKLERAAFAQDHWALPGGATRSHLKVQDGCDFMCSFCVIPFARGRARPRKLDNLLEEARALAAAGVQELVLTGVNVGTYQDEGVSLERALDALDRLEGIRRLRIGSIEPTTVGPGLLERMADPAHKLLPFLHLPLQSGSAGVLERMRRRYTPQQYRAEAEAALETVADLCLGTDVLTGFPGESGAEQEETEAFLDSLPFAYFHVFPYSARGGTPAAAMAGQLDAKEKQRRVARLMRLSEAKRLAFQSRFVGRRVEVLFERSRQAGLGQGLTPHYIRVEVDCGPESLQNQILPVRLLAPGPQAMRAELLAGR